MTDAILDITDRRILDLIQSQFPLVERPYAAIAERVATNESDVIERLARLAQAGIVREISAVFDSVRLGYRSTLAAMAVEPARLEEVAAIVSAHPGVSHNYERMHQFSLWFTLTVAGDCSIKDEVERLARKAQVSDFLVLPALRRFKIGVDFDLGTRPTVSDEDESEPMSETDMGPQSQAEPVALSPRDKDAARALQTNLPLEPRPFERLAATVSMSEGELLDAAKRFLAAGVMRRYCAVLRHRRVGYGVNAMVCWAIPAERIEEAGQRAARERAVSHCYERPSFPPRWPYNLMTMIHGRSENEVREVVQRLLADLKPDAHAVLFSHREFKKQRVRYFEPDFPAPH